MKLAVCQLAVGENKADNLRRAEAMLLEAKAQGAETAILPEMFNIAYRAALFAPSAEPCPGGESFQMLSAVAKRTGLFIVGGSVPELEDGKVYNTSLVFASDGALLGKYRKAHLFDVNVPKVNYSFRESDTIARPENYPLVVDGPWRTAVSICFDIRFPEWARYAMDQGADLLALPAAFARTTGPRHWELLIRARALDNQMFVAGVQPAQSQYAYGHSVVATPDGAVLLNAGKDESLTVLDLDESTLTELRESIPVKESRRKDLYTVCWKKHSPLEWCKKKQ